MLALHDAVRYGDQSCLSRLVKVAHAAAVTHRNADAIYAAAQELEQIGALLLAADAAAQASVAYQTAGERQHAGVAAGTANRLAAACGGLRTPALELAGSPLPLTVREREIANFVAAGLSNREIESPEQLTLSVRTVEGHLYRAYTKVDCTHRDQLAALIRSGQLQ
jgi:DNA-binding NarL/FixJ family response regulator